MDKTGGGYASPMKCLIFYSYQACEFCNTVFLDLKREESEIYLQSNFSKKYRVRNVMRLCAMVIDKGPDLYDKTS